MRRCFSCWAKAMSRSALRGSSHAGRRAEHKRPRCRVAVVDLRIFDQLFSVQEVLQ